MREDVLADALYAYSHQTPFRPFTVELVNRVRLVAHPEVFRIESGVVGYIAPNGTVRMFDPSAVARLVSVALAADEP